MISLPLTVATTSGEGGRWQPVGAIIRIPLPKSKTAKPRHVREKPSTCKPVLSSGTKRFPALQNKSPACGGDRMWDSEPRAKTEVTPPERLVAGADGRLRRRRSTWLRGGRLNTGGAQCPIDHHPKLCFRQSPGNSLSVDKHGGRTLQA